jgi:hypothetical protein
MLALQPEMPSSQGIEAADNSRHSLVQETAARLGDA